MKSLVTGGCGFIGSHLVDRLVDIGHDVIVLDRVQPSNENKKAKYYIQNLSENYFKYLHHFEGVDNVFHLASDVSIPYCVEKPNESMANNTLSTMNVLECSRIHKIKKFMFSSTSAVYGNSLFLPSVETNPVKCLNTYSISKYTGEQLCKMYYELYGLKTVIFRYFNVYGERQHKTGQYAPVMSIFMRQKENGEPLTIIGDGYQTRDFIHVSDVVNANILAAEQNLSGRGGEIFNVGSGNPCTIMKLANMIHNKCEHVAPRFGEARFSCANIIKMKNTFGWEPKVNLEEWLKTQ